MKSQIEIESFNEVIQVQRILGSVKGSDKSPTIIHLEEFMVMNVQD